MCDRIGLFGLCRIHGFNDPVCTDEVSRLFYSYFRGTDGNYNFYRTSGIPPDRVSGSERCVCSGLSSGYACVLRAAGDESGFREFREKTFHDYGGCF